MSFRSGTSSRSYTVGSTTSISNRGGYVAGFLIDGAYGPRSACLGGVLHRANFCVTLAIPSTLPVQGAHHARARYAGRSRAASALRLAAGPLRSRPRGWESTPADLTVLAEAHLGAGDERRASARAEEAVAITRQRESRQEIEAQLALARVRRRAEFFIARPAIEAALDRSLALVMETGSRGWVPAPRRSP
jgi:hypothetical protein